MASHDSRHLAVVYLLHGCLGLPIVFTTFNLFLCVFLLIFEQRILSYLTSKDGEWRERERERERETQTDRQVDKDVHSDSNVM